VLFDLATLPPNHLVTQQDVPNDQQPANSDLTDSDVDPNTGMTPSTGPLDNDELDLSLDLGIYPAGHVTIGDTVWYDDNFDGIQDGNEQGVVGVTVNLFDSAGNSVTDMNGDPVGPTTTDSNGNYLFDELPAGDYYVEFDLNSLPAGYQPTLQDATSDQSDSDADPTNGQTAATGFLDDGEKDLTLDMGIVAPVSVGDTVWYDNDSDGLQDSDEDSDEPGVPGVTVALFDATGNPATDMAGNPVGPTTTDSNGNYTFDNLPPGDYYVQFDLGTLPSGYVPTAPNMGGNDAADSDASPATGKTPSTGFLPSGSHDPTLDMGIVQLAGVRVGDRVWYDDNVNGIQDAGEMGVAGVTVDLFYVDGTPVLDMNGNLVGPTVTDMQGNYIFDNLPEGNYYVQFDLETLPADSIVTLQDATSSQPPAPSDQLDSDADPTTGKTATTGNLVTGEKDLTLDMGIYRPASIGDKVWDDLDADGMQDAGEPGIEGVVVELFNADGSPATDINSNPVTTTTDANGNYLFDELYPGDYYVEFTTPVGYSPSPQDATSDQVDSDSDPFSGQTPITALSSGENDPTWDAGFYKPDPGMVRIGDRVWYDDDRDGLQDPGEDGVAGVVVELFDAADNPVNDIDGNLVGPTFTDMNGNYLFDNLPAGDYYVQFDLGTLPADSIVTLQDATSPQRPATSDPLDSDADPITGQTATTGELVPGEEDLTLDLGIYQNEPVPMPDDVQVGDRVWYDNNGDGVQDSSADEPGVEGVTVRIYSADGMLVTDLAGDVVEPVLTDAAGHYLFDSLPAGDYYVEFDLSTIPAGYQPTQQNGGSDDGSGDDIDSDGNPDSGQTDTTGFLPEGSQDLTLDLGIMAPVKVGDRVWYDYDGDGTQDDPAEEPGVEGVAVILLNAGGVPATDMAGNPVAPTTTDADGYYLFENLPPGDYQVMFDLDTLPENHKVTEQNATNDQQPTTSDQSDSDGDPVTGLTDPTGPLMAGAEYLHLDLGILPIPPVEIGDTVWYDEDRDGIQDADEDGVEGVTAILFNADGVPVTDMDGNPAGPITTDSNGNYLFDNLPAGDYYVQFDLMTLPDGYEVTEQNATNEQQPATSDQVDSDGDPVTGETAPTGFLSEGSQDLSLDLGISPVQPVRVGDRVWYDNDSDGIQDAPADEPGVAGVEVMVFNVDGSPVVDMNGNAVGSQRTDNDGNYLFDNLPPGDYYVQFDLGTLPANYTVTQANAGNDDAADSDANTSTGETDSTGILAGGSENLTLDMGIVLLDSDIRVGDRVWLDDDKDGIQDPGEPGVEGITVNLYETTISDLIGTTVTDADGNYLFDELLPSDYFVQFDLDTLPA